MVLYTIAFDDHLNQASAVVVGEGRLDSATIRVEYPMASTNSTFISSLPWTR